MSPNPFASTAPSAVPLAARATGARQPRRRERLLIGGLATLLALTIGGAGWWGVAPLASLDAWLLDRTLLHTLPATDGSGGSGREGRGGHGAQRTAVVDIDEVSLAAVGQWPWPRYRVAALIQRVAAAQPAAIGLDILFPEADRTSLANIQQTFKTDFGIDMQFSGVPAGLLDNDGFLASVMARTAVVGSQYYYFDHATRRADGRPTPAAGTGLTIEGGQQLPDLPVASGLMDSAPVIAAGTLSSGFVNNRLDRDGTLRRLPMLIRYGGSVAPSLSLATAMHAAGATRAEVVNGPHGASIRFGNQRVPVDARGQATLRFEGASDAYASVSALEVLNGHVDPAFFRDRIVFIGSTAAGTNDIQATAIDARFPGLKIHAVAVGNLLGNRFVEQPRWAGGVAFVACLGVGATVAVLFTSGVGAGLMLGGVGGLALLLGGCSLALFMTTGLFVSPGAPLALVLALVPVGFVVRFTVERQRAARFLAHLANARQVTMESMAAVAETRDPETGAHIKRTQHYVRAVALELRRSGLHLQTLNAEYIELLFLSAPLHDIGKVGIPDHILLKPGRLTPDEMALMKTHAGLGRQIVASTAGHIAGDNFLVVAGEIAGTHHEKWDGSGYPSGLTGEAIPLPGRIMAVADIYDALISRRCYKEPFPHEVATAMMREMRGSTFDPAVLDAFFRIEAEIQGIAARFRDVDEDHAAKAGGTPAELTARVVRRLTDLPLGDSGASGPAAESGALPLTTVQHVPQVLGSIPGVHLVQLQRCEAEAQDVDGTEPA